MHVVTDLARERTERNLSEQLISPPPRAPRRAEDDQASGRVGRPDRLYASVHVINGVGDAFPLRVE